MHYKKLIKRLLPPYGVAREIELGDRIGLEFGLLFEAYTQLYGFDYSSIKIDSKPDAYLGFLSAAIDVYAQHNGGRAGGMGALNGYLKTLQLFHSEQLAELFLSKTMDLQSAPTPEFVNGQKCGAHFGNGVALEDVNRIYTSIRELVPIYYRQFCRYPDGRKSNNQ